MKYLASLLILLTSICASAMTSIEGKMVFEKGQYYVSNKPVIGLSLSELRKYEDRQVVVEGKPRESGELEVYKISVKTESGYKTSYDWDVVNETYYGGGF
ncbi:hypothetical protein [Bermanella sp. R86510]|uniref:hypothetical protein n=1 Tax=unclassified Bermanella TaxID=2627862 RepID=UPI0037C864A1